MQTTLPENYHRFQDILSDRDLAALFNKYGVQDLRQRKLPVYHFFWLVILSAAEPTARSCLLSLIGFFIGAGVGLAQPVTRLSKTALSKRFKQVSWYLFRGVYQHLLTQYRAILPASQLQGLARFKDIVAIDGSVISLCQRLAPIFASVHQNMASLKLNVKYSLHLEVVTKLQVSSGKRHDSRFSAVSQAAAYLYLVDLGYWSFKLMQKIMAAHSFFVMRLKSSCDPLIVKVNQPDCHHLIGQRLSAIRAWLSDSGQDQLDLTVQLSQAKKPRFTAEIRLVGLWHEGQWHFYVTNLFDPAFTPALIYQLYALRWQVELFFNVIKNLLGLGHLISHQKNGLMIEIYAALILHLLTRIVIALAARKSGQPIHQFSVDRSFKLIKGFLLTNLHLFFRRSLQALETLFAALIDSISHMGLRQKSSAMIQVSQQLAP